jgi:ferrous iron transport protein A
VTRIVPLHLLEAGETGCIIDVDGEARLVQRLDEMGLRRGTNVRVIQPGDPCIVAFDHQRLSFRGEGEAIILVEVSQP